MKNSVALLLFSLLLLLSSCFKKKEAPCHTLLNIAATNATPTVGDDITLNTRNGEGMFTWYGPNNFSEQKYDVDDLTIYDIKLNQSGWYYCTQSRMGCGTLHDSIYIDVKLEQGTPSCALTNNSISGTGIPTTQASYIRKSFSSTWNCKMLEASGSYGYPTYTFLFNSYNGNTEPKDGIYITQNIPSFDPFDDANAIHAICQYGMFYFASQEGQKIYVSHVNGKLRIALCDLKFSGNNGGGTYVTSGFTGQVTEQ